MLCFVDKEGCFLPRKRLSPEERKDNITFRLPGWLIKAIKAVPGYNSVVEEILSKYFRGKD